MSQLALAIPITYLVTLTTYVVIEAERYLHRHVEYGERKPDTPQGTDGHTTKPSSGEDGGTKTPDPVVSDGGHDYAGLAIPVRGPITARTRLGIGCVVRNSTPIAADFNEVREAVKYAARKVGRKRRRPYHDTRSWDKVRRTLEFDPMQVANQFRREIRRAREAAGVIRDIQEMVHRGNFHLDL